MFLGFFRLAIDTVVGVEQARTGDVPVAADAAPVYTVLDADANILATGNCTAFGAYTGAWQFSFSTSSPTFQRGKSYLVRVTYTVASGSARVGEHTFIVT